MTTKITAAHVEAALIARYPANAYAIAFKVANATGAAASRAADCVAMSCWPSRGLSVIGHEIKVSRSDWVKERDTPAKADAIARYCDEWWLCVSDAKIVQPGELPPPQSELRPKTVFRTVVDWQQDYPRVHWWFCSTRGFAETVTLRVLNRFWERDRRAKGKAKGDHRHDATG